MRLSPGLTSAPAQPTLKVNTERVTVEQEEEVNLLQLWWTGLTSPRRAFAEPRSKPAPQWGFWVVLVFNLAISAITLLGRYLLGQDLLMPSALTFLPTEKYLLAEMFFLPPLRVLVGSWARRSSTWVCGWLGIPAALTSF